MSAEPEDGEAERGGDRRGPDRREGERRRVERRAPPPVWARPWALVSYGVVGALTAVILFNSLSRDETPPAGAVVPAPPPTPAADTTPPPAAARPPQDAFTTADFERLVLEGQEARGRTVRTELYCGTPDAIALRHGVPNAERAVLALRDSVGRVPAAECKWGARGDKRRQDFLLLIPPDLAEDFAGAPVITDGFVRRRRLMAEVEWVGRSQILSLRTVGVLRRVLAP